MARRYRHLPWVSDTVISLDEGHQASHVNHVPIMPLVSMAPEDAAGLGTPSGAGAGSLCDTLRVPIGSRSDEAAHRHFGPPVCLRWNPARRLLKGRAMSDT